jgi:hypothetical protein
MSRNESKGIQDQIKVKIRRIKAKKFEDILIRVAAVAPRNGVPVVFGRMDRNGCDRHVEVAEVVFRRNDEFALYNTYNGYAASAPGVFRVDSTVFGEISRS